MRYLVKIGGFLLYSPSLIITVLAYGGFAGTIILISIFCASSVGYLVGAYLRQPIVEKITGRKTEEKKHPTSIITILEYRPW